MWIEINIMKSSISIWWKNVDVLGIAHEVGT